MAPQITVDAIFAHPEDVRSIKVQHFSFCACKSPGWRSTEVLLLQEPRDSTIIQGRQTGETAMKAPLLNCLQHFCQHTPILRSPEYFAWTDVSSTAAYTTTNTNNSTGASSSTSSASTSSTCPYSPASDMWSFAGILLHMATGQPPLSHLSQQRAAVMISAQRQLPLDTPTTTLPESLPAALKRLVGDCLHPDPAARPTAGQALQVRLLYTSTGMGSAG